MKVPSRKRRRVKAVSILIADDHFLVRRGLRAVLEGHKGWQVVAEASTGREAVKEAGRLRPDLAILDIGMPELNGFDATRLILKAAPQTRVLILTIHDAEQLVDRAMEAGAQGYVGNSFAETDLVFAIETVLQGRTFFNSKTWESPTTTNRRGQLVSNKVTLREREIIRLLAEGNSNKEVAARLRISVRTVENYRARIMQKLQLRSFSDLVRYAIRNGMVTLDSGRSIKWGRYDLS